MIYVHKILDMIWLRNQIEKQSMIFTLQHIMHCGMMFFSASLPRSAAEFEAELAPAARRFLAPGPTVGRHQNGASHAPPEGPFRWKIFEEKL